MTRPFAVSGLTLFFVMLALSFVSGAKSVMIAGAVCFALFVCSLLHPKSRKRARLPLCFLSALTGCLLFLVFCVCVRQPALSFAGTRQTLCCTVCDTPYTDRRQQDVFTVRAVCADGTRIPGYVRVTVRTQLLPEPEIQPGDQLCFSGSLYALGGDNRDSARSYQSRMLFLGVRPVLRVTVQKQTAVSPYARLLRLRQKMVQTLLQSFDTQQAGFLSAVLFGDKNHLPDGLYQSFRRAGAAHIMAVSGLHLSAWVFFLLSLFRRRMRDLRMVGVVLSGAVVVLMALAGFSGSVLRAGLMMLVYLFGFVLRREPDAVNALGFAATVLLLVHPAFCMHVGFLLSVLSTLAILVFALPLSARLETAIANRAVPAALASALQTAGTSVCISLCVGVLTLPVQIYAFGTVSLAGVGTNLLLLPFLLPVLVFAGLFLALHAVPLLGDVLWFFCDTLARYCIKVASLMSRLPFAELTVSKSAAAAALAVSAAAALLLYALLDRRRRLDLLPESVV